MDIKKIHKAKYNPRRMSKNSRKALGTSIKTFGNISGITVNERTGNIISGNHRYEEVTTQHGGIKNLVLTHLRHDYYSLDTKKGEHTGYLIRTVDWDLEKEKAANVTANSDLVSGEFTSGLQDVLGDIKLDLEDSLFSGLRLSELKIDLDGLDVDLDLEDDFDIVDRSIEKNRMLDDAKGENAGDVKEIRSTVKISTPSDLRDEVKQDLLEFLSKKKYYDDIIIT